MNNFIMSKEEVEQMFSALLDPTKLDDAQPRTLYVRRDVLNADAIVAWAKEQGFETTLPAEDMHVTIAFSRAALDWSKIDEDWNSGDDKGHIRIKPGGVRLLEKFNDAVVLIFTSSILSWRHESIKQAGASWDHQDYQPHVTITYESHITDDVEPYRGEIILGPEIFEKVNEDWKSGVIEDSNPYREPAGSSKGGEFASGPGGSSEKDQLENQLTLYAEGKVSASEVQTVFKKYGWSVNLRRARGESRGNVVEAHDPFGKQHWLYV